MSGASSLTAELPETESHDSEFASDHDINKCIMDALVNYATVPNPDQKLNDVCNKIRNISQTPDITPKSFKNQIFRGTDKESLILQSWYKKLTPFSVSASASATAFAGKTRRALGKVWSAASSGLSSARQKFTQKKNAAASTNRVTSLDPSTIPNPLFNRTFQQSHDAADADALLPGQVSGPEQPQEGGYHRKSRKANRKTRKHRKNRKASRTIRKY